MKKSWPIITAIIIPIILVGIFIWFDSVKSPVSSPVLSSASQSAASPSEQSSPSAVADQTKKEDNPKTMTAQPAMQIDQNKTYTATLKTSEGDIEIALNTKQMPITVNNFISLARSDFYNNTIFHRIIKGFMIQGGDPTGTGTGGPGYKFNDEPFEGEYARGTVAMANSGKNTNGSQFFIMHADTGLPKNYVIFGKVTSGLDVVDKIATAPTQPGGEGSTPVSPVKIQSVEIIEQ